MRLTQIRDFLAVVEAGSMRAAARNLGISQPTITKSVRGLEEELHVQLLGRSARGIALTQSGRAFFARVRVAQSELRKAEEEASMGGTESVALGVGPMGAVLYLPEAVRRFREQYPQVRIRITEGTAQVLMPHVRDGVLDFLVGLRSVGALTPVLRFRPLYRSELVVAARKSHPLRNARSLGQLAQADWLSTPTLALPRGPLQYAFSNAGLSPPRQVVLCESYNAVVSLLANSDMLGLMQRHLLRAPFAREFLQQIEIAETMPYVTAGMYTRADTPLTRVAATMAKAVAAVARKLAHPI